MVQKYTIDFLKQLKKNNKKEWFDTNKDKYLAAKANVESLVEDVIKAFLPFEKGLAGLKPKDCVFRIYRDVRFSKDKRPYKTNMGASINPGGKKMEIAGYYLHIEPGGSFIAGGRWMPDTDHLKKIRQEIDYNGKAFHKILDDKNFKKQFGGLDMSDEYRLSRPPKGYEKDHKDIEFLKLNSYLVWRQFSDKDVLAKNFLKELTVAGKTMKPLLDFLNTAID